MNLESIIYVGPRPGVGKEWNRRRYTFKHSKAVSVPDEFAKMLIATMEFIRADDAKYTIDQRYPGGGTLLFRRWGALGDLLMFRAIVSAWKRFHGDKYKLALRCQDGYVPLFEQDALWSAGVTATSIAVDKQQYNGIVSFDQVAEGDHRGDQRHRVDLFMTMLTTEKLTLTVDDWRVPITHEIADWVRRHMNTRGLLREDRKRPLIAVQVHGSGRMKSLPPHVVERLVITLAADYDVMLIEPIEKMTEVFTKRQNPPREEDRVHTMCNRDALHCIEMLRYVDLAITMDSGALWMAHCAPCPVVAILGPTRPQQRISLHPYYPQQARAVCLNDNVVISGKKGCPACFENAKACNGKFACMQGPGQDWDWVISEVMTSVVSMLSGTSESSDVSLAVLPEAT